jgi:hypothetical protein
VVWERVGRPREACASWIRAARWRNQAEDAAWKKAVACARKDPGAGDWKEVRDYALSLAPAERRETLAAELDAASEVDAGASAARPAPAPAPAAR